MMLLWMSQLFSRQYLRKQLELALEQKDHGDTNLCFQHRNSRRLELYSCYQSSFPEDCHSLCRTRVIR